MTPLYPVAAIRAIEEAALRSVPEGALMKRAGAAAASAATRLLRTANGRRVLVLAGPGNNGGDALEAAAMLAHNGMEVTILSLADATSQPADARHALVRARAGTASFTDPSAIPQGSWDLAIDGLFGIGLRRPITGQQAQLVEFLNRQTCPVLALDVPSGLDADTGVVVGPDGVAVQASHTLTFIGDKPGLHTGAGRDFAGNVEVATLGIDERLFPPAQAFIACPALFDTNLRRRRHATHKGSFGDVAVLGGASGMAGAVVLAASAAAQCGAGRVFAGFVGAAPPYDSFHPELMCRDAASLEFSGATLVAGPGLGTSLDAHDLLARVLAAVLPLVLDADALNLIAAEAELRQKLLQRSAPSIMTPHPLEAARLLATSSAAIQSDRPQAARHLAARFNCVVVLKGSGTTIARPDGVIIINPTGNPGLATAGTGDVLSGICGALLAQGWPAWEAAIGAVWIHGKAADELVLQGIGPVGLRASELIPVMRAILNRLIAD